MPPPPWARGSTRKVGRWQAKPVLVRLRPQCPEGVHVWLELSKPSVHGSPFSCSGEADLLCDYGVICCNWQLFMVSVMKEK